MVPDPATNLGPQVAVAPVALTSATTTRPSPKRQRRHDTCHPRASPQRWTSSPSRTRRGPRQRKLGDFFPSVTEQQRATQVRRDFKNERRKEVANLRRQEAQAQVAGGGPSSALHKQERTFSCTTLNVNGFGSRERHRDEYFREFRHDDAHGRHDVVFLQETHVEAEEVEHMASQHSKQWGFRQRGTEEKLSFWSPSTDCKGGVAILLDPYGRLRQPKPVLTHAWNSHFMAVTGMYAGVELLLICIYAPHQTGPREAFYRNLSVLDLPQADKLVVGGDFNCTLDPRLDRSWFRKHSGHDSPALAELLANWGLVDALAPPNDATLADTAAYYENTHTYTYTVHEGVEASARLDRWYISAPLVDWVAAVEVFRTGTQADHRAVRLHLRSPDDPVRIRKPAKVYPPPSIAAGAVREATQRRLQSVLEELQTTDPTAERWAQQWDQLKIEVRKETLAIIKQRRKAARATYKQRMRRLIRQEARLREAAAGQAPSVASITDSMDVLTLAEGDGGSPLHRVRHAITACAKDRAAAQQRRLFRDGGHRDGKTMKSMFRRVSTKYADSEIHRLDAAVGHSARGVHDKADTLADAWTPIFQQQGSTAAARLNVLQWLGDSGQYQGLLADLTRPFTEAEVAAAIGASKRGKACGPDRLGNDWYRDFGDQLIPILTILYNCWYPRGVFPATFLEADIFCLKKGGESADPLNYRPLSLLNTDYKLLTRMTATRTSGKLSAIVHPNQNGFVPYRTIHATVDLFTAAQAAAKTDPEMARALALLLDFMKAYDSVDREFLYAVLRWLGFPDDYVQAMRAVHNGTKVRFLANGYKSRWVSVSCGIRQGCPLAPLLFLLVLEALYRRIDAEPRVSGIVLKSAAGEVKLKVGGYADDTASYVRTVFEVVIILEITRLFALASGLRLNESKTLVIALNPAAIPLDEELPSPLKVQAVSKLSRYLGLPVGSVPDVAYTWRLARTQLVTRLALAARKTMTAEQRSMVVMAVVIPKLLYIGRHQWPTTELVADFQKMIDNFVWHARFSADAVAGRAWINRHVAALPRRDGGLAVPNLKLELLAHAAVTVNTWAIEADTTTLVVGDVIAGVKESGPAPMLYVSPRATLPPKTGPKLRETIWTTGVHLCNAYGGVVAVAEKADMVRALHCLQYFRGPIALTWRGRRLILDASTLRGHLWTRYTTTEALQHGEFCVEWLPYLVLKDLRLYSEKGTTVNPASRFWGICAVGVQIKDVLHWTWTRQHRLVVTVLCTKVTRTIQRQVGHLMQLLILNFPQLLLPGDHSGRVRYSTRGEGGAQIHRCITSERRLVGQGGAADEGARPGDIHSHRELTRCMQRDVGSAQKIDMVHPHPRLARMACLWKGERRWKATRRSYKAVFGAIRVQKGKATCVERQGKWERLSRPAAGGLKTLTWKRIRRIVGLNPWGEQLLYRVKLHALSVYNPVTSNLSCPHAGCERVTRVDLFHVFWECPAARTLRDLLVRRWESTGLRLTSYEEAIFALTLPTIPAGIAAVTGRVVSGLPDADIEEIGATVDNLIRSCWSLGAALYLHAVWRWRVAHFDPLNDVTTEYHVAGLKTRLHHGHMDVTSDYYEVLPSSIRTKLCKSICAMLGAGWDGPYEGPPVSGHCYLLAVAGIQGDTPRHCSSGVVIAKVHQVTGAYQLMQVGSKMYAGAHMVHLRAIYLGLAWGLRHCLNSFWGPVHVVGDDADATRQQLHRTPPKGKHLKGEYWKARRLADVTAVSSWTTQTRDYNRTAREFARMALSTGRTMEWNAGTMPEAGARWGGVSRFIAADVAQWLQEHEKSTNLLVVEDTV